MSIEACVESRYGGLWRGSLLVWAVLKHLRQDVLPRLALADRQKRHVGAALLLESRCATLDRLEVDSRTV